MAGVLAAACTAQTAESPAEAVVFTADIGPESKAEVSSGKVKWEAGDRVAVSDGVSCEVVTLNAADISTDGSSAKLRTISLQPSPAAFYAVFPASRFVSVSSGSVRLSSSSSQTEATQKPAVSTCKGNERVFRFRNVSSMLKFDTASAFSKAVLSSPDGTVAAALSVSPETGISSAKQDKASSATYTPASPTAGTHYIELAQGETLPGFTIDLYDSSGKISGRFTYSSSLSTSRGKIFTISNFDSRTTKPEPEVTTYVKVTSAPADWAGRYLLVLENGANAKVWGGKDAAGSYVSATVKDSRIQYASGMAILEVSAISGGWAVRIAEGWNKGSYISGSSGSNKTNFGTTPSPNSLEFTGGSAKITSNTSVMRFNKDADMFRYYKSSSYSSQQPVQLYRADSFTPGPTVTTGAASSITSSGAALEGSWAGAGEPTYEHRIEYGRSATNLDQVVYYNGTTGPSGSFKLQVSGLASNTTYYYRAAVQVGTTDHYGEVKSFKTLAGPDPYSGKGWAELPAIYDADGNGVCDKDNTLYYAKHVTSGSEKGPDGKPARNYTVCYSSEHHCPLWVAAPRHSMYVGSAGRTDAYKRDPDIPSGIQLSSKSTGGGCNKGHMLGSAERTSSSAMNSQVFYYSNIAPQNSTSFNTGGGAWNNLEEFVSSKVCADTLYEVVGCYFEKFTDDYGNVSNPSRIEFGGRKDVSKPTMFYYALLRTKSGNSHKAVTDCSASELQCAAFVISHTMGKGHKPQARDMMSISDLEALTGVSYFTNVPNAPKTSFSASDWGL